MRDIAHIMDHTPLRIQELEGIIVAERIRGKTRLQCMNMLIKRGWAPAPARRFVDNVIASDARHRAMRQRQGSPITPGMALVASVSVITIAVCVAVLR
jgi:hypothetical protein